MQFDAQSAAVPPAPPGPKAAAAAAPPAAASEMFVPGTSILTLGLAVARNV